MARYRRAFSIRPVTSSKREISWSQLGTDFSGTNGAHTLVKAVIDPSAANDYEVPVGTHVKWIYIEFNVNAVQTGTTKVDHWFIVKNPGGLLSTNPSLYNQTYKKFILKRGMEMVPNNVSTVIKRIAVVRLPKRLSRFDEDDTLFLYMRASSAETQNFCGFVIYKAFY